MPDAVGRFRSAYLDPDLVVLEGLHALKHAVRFGARIVEAVVSDPDRVRRLARRIAPDIDLGAIPVTVLDAAAFARVARVPPATGTIAITGRRTHQAADILEVPGAAPVVLLENTRRLENIGACIRVAAAAGAAGILTLGVQDPWHPVAIRGAAGLQFALPVARIDALPPTDRPLFAFDAAGDALGPGSIPARAILAFGTERAGLSTELCSRAERRVRIPMQPGVSSLNVATAVAIALYAWRGLSS